VRTQEILNRLHRFVVDQFLDGDASELAPDTPLLEWGVLDSLSMLVLLSYVEQDLGIPVPDEQVRPEHFQDLQHLSRMLARLAGTATPPGVHRATPASVISRVVREGQGVRTTTVNVAGHAREVPFAPGARPGWLLIPGPFNPSVSWGAVLRTQVGATATWAPPLLGLGPDDDGSEAVPFARQVDALLELEQALDVEPMVLVGNGLGGALALEIARRRPDRVRALAIVAYGKLDRPRDWWQRMLKLTEDPSAYLAKAFFQLPAVPTALLERMETLLASPAYQNYLVDADLELLERQFDAIDVPTLFVGAEQDAILPREAVNAAAACVPGSRVEWLSRCGHLAHMERSSELLATINSFVASLEPLETA